MMRNGAAGLLSWLHTFRRATPAADAGVSLGWGQHGQREERVCVSDVVDIEESVWAPRYGLKGMVDASVELSFDSGALGASAPASALARCLFFRVVRLHQCTALRSLSALSTNCGLQAASAEGASMDAARLSRVVAPLEFKTGKAHQSHRAQVPRERHLVLVALLPEAGADCTAGFREGACLCWRPTRVHSLSWQGQHR